MTNIMSNVAAANMFLPALACVAPLHGQSPVFVLAPIALSTSAAFLFPISTPPNAMILTNGNVTLEQLFKIGLLCTGVFLCTIVTYCLYVLPVIYGYRFEVTQSIMDTCTSTQR